MTYLGDYKEDYTKVNFTFATTVGGTMTALAGTPAISVYKGNSATQSTAGITLTEGFDSNTGSNQVLIDLSADAFYAVGEDYTVYLSAGTLAGITVVGRPVAYFSIENRFDEVDVTKISSDSTAADNLELQYDTTGLTGGTFPANQDQVLPEVIARLINPQVNTAFSNITFEMYNDTFHTPATGLTITGERSLDGGAYAAVTGTIAEISDGTYQIDASAADMNGALVVFKFTATDADASYVHIKTAA